jgi:hypothetical protein
MKADGASPLVERSARALGVRVPTDISPDPEGNVHPMSGGMSVAPDDAMFLPQHRRPDELGGTGPDPVWQLEDAKLLPGLSFREDYSTHGLIEPAQTMQLSSYEVSLAATQQAWERTT